MIEQPCVMADWRRTKLFLEFAQRRLHQGKSTAQVDSQGIVWRRFEFGDIALAVPAIGPGWAFESALRPALESLPACAGTLLDPASSSTASQQRRIDEVVKKIRVGGHCSRLCFAIHAAILATACSTFRIADNLLGSLVYGSNPSQWHKNWRGDLLSILEGLTHLHLVESDRHADEWGSATTLLNHVADLRGTSSDVCDCCSELDTRSHHHFLIVAGRGFLGALEQLATVERDDGTREYDFYEKQKLRQLGKRGHTCSVFLPAILGNPRSELRLSPKQQRLLAALVRELTRPPKATSKTSHGLVQHENLIPSTNGKHQLSCSQLDPGTDYVCFGGNGVRRGLGYLLLSERGWLSKCGYRHEAVRGFFDDLNSLCERLGLIAVGIRRTDQSMVDLTTMQSLAGEQAGRRELEDVHLRVYGPQDFLERWTSLFGFSAMDTSHPIGPTAADAMNEELRRLTITQKQLAEGIEVDPSYLSKVLRGKKPLSNSLLAKIRTHLIQKMAMPRKEGQLDRAIRKYSPSSNALLDVAYGYLDLGWTVIPQLPGKKRPAIKWKKYQQQAPSRSEWQTWAKQWPDAGLLLVLGKVSDVLVIDVDGLDAYEALLARLGMEPIAPKVISGSRAPGRFHLYFAYPEIDTDPKATPWHPKLEFRGEKGLVVLPPSLHSSGHLYKWSEGQSMDELIPPPLPWRVLDALRDECKTCEPRRQVAATSLADDGFPKRLGKTTLEFLAGKYAQGPHWNDRLYRAACDMQSRGVSQEEATRLLESGAEPRSDSDRSQMIRTIDSAYSHPRDPSRS